VRLLVCGGAGYIGSVVGARLLEEGHAVTVADSLVTGHEDAVPEGARFVEVDLLGGRLPELLDEGFDAVLHFAALSIVPESVAHPTLYFRANVGGTVALLDAMRAARVKRLVFSSTAAVYGEPDEVPIPETAATRPTNRTVRRSSPSTRHCGSSRQRRAWRPSASGTSTSPERTAGTASAMSPRHI
jgi:UDP-glucose 4-epimerase